MLAALTAVAARADGALFVRSRKKWRAAYRCALFVLDVFLTVCAAFSLLWGANYYADDFCDKSGLSPAPVAYEDLLHVTRYFANRLSLAQGRSRATKTASFAADRQEILAYADTVYDCLYEEFPFSTCLITRPRASFCSKIMSAMNFTGFTSRLRGVERQHGLPAMLLASTCAHELAHQRGIASEQQCNFLCGSRLHAL